MIGGLQNNDIFALFDCALVETGVRVALSEGGVQNFIRTKRDRRSFITMKSCGT